MRLCDATCSIDCPFCICGNEVIWGYNPGFVTLPKPYCCNPPSVKCYYFWFMAWCPVGEILPAEHYVAPNTNDEFDVDGTIPCHDQCFNDYFKSEHLGMSTHYTCPDKCVHWSGLCRGVSYCDGDQEICGEDLRCPSFLTEKFTMPTEPPRSYCFNNFPHFLGKLSKKIIDKLINSDIFSKFTPPSL